MISLEGVKKTRGDFEIGPVASLRAGADGRDEPVRPDPRPGVLHRELRQGGALLPGDGVVGTEQKDEQRLRASAEEHRSLYLRGYESPDGEEIGPLMRVVRPFLYAVLGDCTTFSHSLSQHVPLIRVTRIAAPAPRVVGAVAASALLTLARRVNNCMPGVMTRRGASDYANCGERPFHWALG